MTKTAFIDLTTSAIRIQETDPELLEDFPGGRGLGAALAFGLIGQAVSPFDPENCLVFTTGLFNDTPWPASARYNVTFMSPATGGYGYANAGGHLGPELRRAGYDAVIVTGKAPHPRTLRVTDTGALLFPADDLWGRKTSVVETRLREKGGRVAAIGPAGENLVHMAAIISDGGRAAARGGPGAVMGSKRLKAVHVCSERRRPRTPGRFRKLAGQKSRQVLRHPGIQGLSQSTTLLLMETQNHLGTLPARNHQVAGFPFIDDVDVAAFRRNWTKTKGCSSCPVRCSRRSQTATGHGIIEIEGPEYETASAFGPMCWNADPRVVIQANHLCNELGLDTISTGVTIAFAMECHERGLLDDGMFSLDWGDGETILGLVESIAYRKGLGEILADGSLFAGQRIGRGAEQYAMQVKGLEMPRQEPRKAKAFGLGHATSNRGADHLYALPTIDVAQNWDAGRATFPQAILERLMDISDETYKPDLVVFGEHYCALADSLGVCKFIMPETYALKLEDLAEGIRAMGREVTPEELLQIGERIVNIERMFNVRLGFDRADDILPKRITHSPLLEYVSSGKSCGGSTEPGIQPRKTQAAIDLQQMLDRYYELRDWDERGVPTNRTLRRLKLDGRIAQIGD